MFQIIFLLSGDLVILLHYISVIALSTVLHICLTCAYSMWSFVDCFPFSFFVEFFLLDASTDE